MIYFDEVFENGETKLWVKNIHKPRGIFILVLSDRVGKQHKLVIPDTSYPICLTNFATLDMLKESVDLRTYISRGILAIVPSAEAEKIWKDPHVKKAVEKAMTDATGRTYRNPVDHMTTKVIKDDLSDDNETRVVTETDSGTKVVRESAVNSRVVVLLEQLKTREIKARECIDQLEGIELNADSYKYIVANSVGLVEKWAKAKLVSHVDDGEDE